MSERDRVEADRGEDDPQRADRALLEALVPRYTGCAVRSIERIPAGLGTRRFHRIRLEVGTSSAADAPWAAGAAPAAGAPVALVARFESDAPAAAPGPETWLPEPGLEPIRGFLERAGLPVPRSVAHLPEEGLDLLEDVGDRTLADARGERRDALYAEACALVPRLQALEASAEEIPAFGRVFDRALLATKAWKWQHWALPGLLGREADATESDAIGAAFECIARLVDPAPRRLAHRDFKAENLHWPQERPVAGGELVMIDVQGAFLAPPEYDLACLLYDLQVDLDETFVQARLRETLERLPDAPPLDEALVRFDALATARLCKDMAHVVHAGRARGDRRRWHELPRGLILLERVTGRLAHTFPELRALRSVIPALTGALGSADSPTGKEGPRMSARERRRDGSRPR